MKENRREWEESGRNGAKEGKERKMIDDYSSQEGDIQSLLSATTAVIIKDLYSTPRNPLLLQLADTALVLLNLFSSLQYRINDNAFKVTCLCLVLCRAFFIFGNLWSPLLQHTLKGNVLLGC